MLFPFSILYGCITWLRNQLYDTGFISSTRFQIPLIVVGNLSVGGTGKSPHIEYLIRLLKKEFKVATLSRGYGRNTEEFILANDTTKATDIGDEPMQFKTKFPEMEVAVDSNRVNGVNKLLKLIAPLNVILLDDGFQHRAVRAGLSILLTDYNNLYCDDFVLPSGTLREWRRGANRADIIIITKCPELISEEERALVKRKIKSMSHQNVYFSFIKYGELIPVNEAGERIKTTNATVALTKQNAVLLLTGIANTKSIEAFIKGKVKEFVPAKFADHHPFTEKDMDYILNLFNTIAFEKKIIVTTEKDWMRLKSSDFINLLNNIPIFYLPIEINFKDKDKEAFNNQISEYVRGN